MISTTFIIKQYTSGIHNYVRSTIEVGLWESEKYIFNKYLQAAFTILDLGCGTGRTTFGLWKMGYENSIGVDLTPQMIKEANRLNTHFQTQILFQIGDATDLRFEENKFDAVIFSFNGIMSIPGHANRQKAVNEIFRVLKDKGIFIFTTHDRNEDASFFSFWEEEKIRWKTGKHDPRLVEFGDIIAFSKNETRNIYIHIPDMKEVDKLLLTSGFAILESFYRSEKFEEPPAVKEVSGECRFWVAKKM